MRSADDDFYPGPLDPKTPAASPDETNKARLAFARRVQRTRNRAHLIFGSPILSDARYEMLLELYIALREGRCVSVSDLALAADVPPTTGLRKLEKLAVDGFVYRYPDRTDRRRSWVRLAPKIVGDFDLLFDQTGDGVE